MKTPSHGISLISSVGVALLVSVPSAGFGQEAASLQGVPVVVELRGSRQHGTDRLSRTLRRTLADELGGLRSSRALHREQDRLEIPQAERTKPSRLAEAGKGVAAEHLVFVRVNRRGKRYEAKGYLIAVDTAKVVHKHTVIYKRPKREAGKAGQEIAKAMLERLRQIKADEAAKAPPPITAIPEPVITQPPPPIAAVEPPPAVGPPPAAPPPAAPPLAAPPPTVVADVQPAPEPARRGPSMLRLGIGAGAGLVRSYTLSASAVGASDLSHSLSPLGLARLSADFVLPGVGIGLSARASLRPVGYRVVTDEATSEPSGLLIDALAELRYHLALSDRGGGSVDLIPSLGARVARSSVGEHDGDVIPSATLVSIFGGVGIRLPYDEHLELEAGIDLGVVASYSESPGTTGESPSGFTFGADFGLNYWFTDLVGVAFDTRFTMDRLGFSNRPTRPVTSSEQAQLQDATVTITDVRTSASVLLRF